MKELIARLEAATEGSRELSDEVLRACGWRWEKIEVLYDGVLLSKNAIIKPDGTYADWKKGEPPSPTESIDAALTLVPEEFARHWSVCEKYGECGAMLGDLSHGFAADFKGHTAPLALCIASLKARS